MIRNIIISICTTLLLCSVAQAQSTYGYLGKRFYLAGDIAMSPAFYSKNEEGNNAFKFNFTGIASVNFVANKRQVITLDYRYHSNVATVSNKEPTIIPEIIEESSSEVLGYYRFRTTEIGFNTKFFFKKLDAPLGGYISVGLGLAISKYVDPFQTVVRVSGQSDEYKLLRYDNTQAVYSPIVRFGVGKQTVFGNRFFYNYSVDLGVNLAVMGIMFGNVNGQGSNYPYLEDSDQTDIEVYAKNGIQRRLGLSQLVNFKMGIGVLLF